MMMCPAVVYSAGKTTSGCGYFQPALCDPPVADQNGFCLQVPMHLPNWWRLQVASAGAACLSSMQSVAHCYLLSHCMLIANLRLINAVQSLDCAIKDGLNGSSMQPPTFLTAASIAAAKLFASALWGLPGACVVHGHHHKYLLTPLPLSCMQLELADSSCPPGDCSNPQGPHRHPSKHQQGQVECCSRGCCLQGGCRGGTAGAATGAAGARSAAWTGPEAAAASRAPAGAAAG